MGVAGGLVPSPSALVVLLSAIALGRTVFGVVLVLSYGAGMAAALVAAGLLLVRVGHRLSRMRAIPGSAAVAYLPLVTAATVTVVGLGLAAHALTAAG
jgi:ABC-type nickel/cobalt efflux system permease component RcnA